MFSRFFGKNSANSVPRNEAQSSAESGAELPNLSAEKLRAVIQSINQAEAVFQSAGYALQQLDIEFGHTPKLTPRFKRLKSISDEEHKQLLCQLDDRQLIKFIVISLHKSGRMQSLFEDSKLYYYGMEIDISSVPSVRTIFKRKEDTAEVVAITPGR